MQPIIMTRRRWLAGAGSALLGLSVSACTSTDDFGLFGYTTRPNYSESIRTVQVPIFKNLTFYRGLEFDLTRAVIRDIESKTPYKVVRCNGDTELSGTIVTGNKGLLLRQQQNTVREAQTVISVNVVWRDLRSGEVLSSPQEGVGAPLINRQLATPELLQPQGGPGGVAADVTPPLVQLDARNAPKVLVQSTATFIPELGESISTSHQKNIDRLATQIVSMMEEPW